MNWKKLPLFLVALCIAGILFNVIPEPIVLVLAFVSYVGFIFLISLVVSAWILSLVNERLNND